MQKLIEDNCKCSFNKDKLNIPEYANHLNIDIGLSFSACHTNQWIKKQHDLFVISIEALPYNVEKLLEGNQTSFHHREKSHYLNKDYINEKCYILPCAITNEDSNSVEFFQTKDSGQCSIYEPPKTRDIYQIDSIINVPSFKLKELLDIINYSDKIQYVEFLKIDVQGADLDIVKSGGTSLQEKVVYLCLEPEIIYGSKDNNSIQSIASYMESINFVRVQLPTTSDPTYINKKYSHLFPPNKYDITCIQNN